MYVLFNQTTPQNRRNGARGGRAFARNLRLRKLLTPPPPPPGTAGRAGSRNGPRSQPLVGPPIPLARRSLFS
jgi:hypothetical protein